MNLISLPNGEQNPVYARVRAENSVRYLHFLTTLMTAALVTNRPLLTAWRIKAINYHATVMLHAEAGFYRQRPVYLRHHINPRWQDVQGLMADLVDYLQANWSTASDLHLAAYAMWRINNIHPFINGNGHTARAVCYYILSMKHRGLFPGAPTLPEILAVPERHRYVAALLVADNTAGNDLIPLMSLIGEVMRGQLGRAP